MSRTITLEKKDFTEYAWKLLLDRFHVPKDQRQGGVDVLNIELSRYRIAAGKFAKAGG